MFKYKDLRMFVFSLFLIGLCVFSGVYFRHDRMKLVVLLLLAFSVIPTLLIRYNASVFEDGMLIYTFRGIGILPQMIEFKDLTAYELISKHKLQLGFKNKTKKIYLLDAKTFYQELDKKYQGYKKGQKVWFIEFKVIAINDLRAAITDKHKAINPFVYHSAEKAN